MPYTPVSALLVVKVVGHDADGAEDLAFLLHTLVEACAKFPNIEYIFPQKTILFFISSELPHASALLLDYVYGLVH